MIILPVTLLAAGVLVLWYAFTSLSVSLRRAKDQVTLGEGGDGSAVQRVVRVHGNTAEYLPLFIVLLGLLEFHGLQPLILYVLAGIFLLGRILHRSSILHTRLAQRIWGMQFTLWPLIIAAFILLYTWVAQVVLLG